MASPEKENRRSVEVDVAGITSTRSGEFREAAEEVVDMKSEVQSSVWLWMCAVSTVLTPSSS